MLRCIVCGKKIEETEERTLTRRKICSWNCLKQYRKYEETYKKHWTENKSLEEIRKIIEKEKKENVECRSNIMGQREE